MKLFGRTFTVALTAVGLCTGETYHKDEVVCVESGEIQDWIHMSNRFGDERRNGIKVIDASKLQFTNAKNKTHWEPFIGVIKAFPKVERVVISLSRPSEAAQSAMDAALGSLSHLKHLSMAVHQFKSYHFNQMLANLDANPSLRTLAVDFPPVKGKQVQVSLSHLHLLLKRAAKHPNLKQLQLGGIEVMADAGSQMEAGGDSFAKLEVLRLYSISFTGKNALASFLTLFPKTPELKELYLYNVPVSTDQLASVLKSIQRKSPALSKVFLADMPSIDKDFTDDLEDLFENVVFRYPTGLDAVKIRPYEVQASSPAAETSSRRHQQTLPADLAKSAKKRPLEPTDSQNDRGNKQKRTEDGARPSGSQPMEPEGQEESQVSTNAAILRMSALLEIPLPEDYRRQVLLEATKVLIKAGGHPFQIPDGTSESDLQNVLYMLCGDLYKQKYTVPQLEAEVLKKIQEYHSTQK